ncbi:NACHT domain-containing protein [Nocardioides bruguierae]|uniref:NACHT domain-containing protein n=1 Tax=Nocardioides bruguierae TaxID=2945102 RepID=UPI00202263E3|nr:NACHT domain-containing protein [Nocardioides bruguierae]MCL8023778.1 NACHT domain-containing protein [Nocardioides bruguierae]
MTELNWDRFEELPGDSTTNFELLWRGAIKHNYARYGRFRARAQQPGVEFHLELEQECHLGEPGRWYGWQTKWWRIGSGTQIGVNRRTDVQDSLNTTKKYLPRLTDWVLCTRRALTPTDQKWYDDLAPGVRLHNAVAEELSALLTGEAALLRETFFGDLILTPHRLEVLQGGSVEEVSERWFPEVHQITEAEQTLRRMLAEPEAWTHLAAIGSEIEKFTAVIEREVVASPLPKPMQAELDELLTTAARICDLLAEAHQRLGSDGDGSWLEIDEVEVPAPPPRTPSALRRLRAMNHPASLACTNLVAHARRASDLANDVFDQLQVRLAVVTGDAGYGKTQLAAKLTTETSSRPAGVLLHGRLLSARDTLDRFASQVSLAGKVVETFEALLAAVDAAASRARCRIPIVIDGLNEAESPAAWKPLLSRLHALLKKYSSVLVVCTIRGDFVQSSIPSSLNDFVELEGFYENLDEAAARYFDYFNIDALGVDLPRELLRRPLALRIYCSVANPDRKVRVSLVDLPRSLNEMFDAYLLHVAERIEQLNPRLSREDVLGALEQFGMELWETTARDVGKARTRELFGDTERRWNEGILTALEQEGVLIRQAPLEVAPQAGVTRLAAGDDSRVAVAYDLLAGHILASAVVRSGGQEFVDSLSTPELTARLLGPSGERHSLATDILDGLTYVLPESGRGHLWQALDPSVAAGALLRTTTLRAGNVDKETVGAFVRNLPSLGRGRTLWTRLQSVRAVESHPLNAQFLDSILGPMAVGDRDLLWSEWLRTAQGAVLSDARALRAHWQSDTRRTAGDALRARWLMWVLTSTVRDLRDAATAALYWYGRHDPAGLCALALDALTVNDPYVGERMVASAYGVVTAHQQHTPGFDEILGDYLHGLLRTVSGSEPSAPTYHRLIRYYIAGTFEFARQHNPQAVPGDAVDGIVFADAPLPEPLPEGDPRRAEVDHTIQMDFGNYTIGRLFDDRRNYDNKHRGHAEATAQVLGVVYDLGWRMELFSDVDSFVGRSGPDRNPGRVERYGKKYGWIGFYLVSGELVAHGSRVPWLEVDIDPTFPQPSSPAPVTISTWVSKSPEDDRDWLLYGPVDTPDHLLHREVLDGDTGPWVLVHAELTETDGETGRRTFGLFNTVAVQREDLDRLLEWWRTVRHPGRDIIDLPTSYYLFAGEVPWHPRMATSGDDLAGTTRPSTAAAFGDDEGPTSVDLSGGESAADPHHDEDLYFDEIRIYGDEGESEDGDEGGSALDALITEYGGALAGTRRKWPKYESVPFESLAHTFAWEGHHSAENQAFAYLPNRFLSLKNQLHAVGASFDQVDPEGRLATKSYAALDGWEGHLLYIREDCVQTYAQGRAIVSFGWGERESHLAWHKMPVLLRDVYQSNRNVWRIHQEVVEGGSSSAVSADSDPPD